MELLPQICFLFIQLMFVGCHSNDIQKPYFVPVTLECIDDTLNTTDNNSLLHSRYWIFPNGQVYTNDDNSPICRQKKCWNMDVSGYNVTINRISDNDFGVYYCVKVMHDHTIQVIRKGLNVDGPYYGDLLNKYKENAKIGGIAAAILFAILAGSCLLWNCRYNRRRDLKDSKTNGELTDINMVHVYDNTGIDNEKL